MTTSREYEDGHAQAGAWEVFLVFLRLGLTSFGGPVAHLGYFRAAFVTQRRWLSERAYSDIVALCQFLPGPASSQVGMVVGLSRAGYGGALAAWLGFTLPSAIALILFAMGLAAYGNVVPAGALHGLKVAAVAVVAQAVWGMARALCPDAPRITLMTLAAVAVTLVPSPWCQMAVMALAGIAGSRWFRPAQMAPHEPLPIRVGHRAAVVCLLAFFVLLIGLPIAARLVPSHALAMVDAFYRAGALVFGGGHVVLPLLQAAAVPTGWVSNDTFLAGYGATQAVPGPLFTFAAFLGAAMQQAPSGWMGGMLCLLAIFAPSFLLVFGTLPFWERIRRNAGAQAALAGINAAVVGLLLAALYQPVWTSAIHAPEDFALALLALVALAVWRLPPWVVVLASGLAGWGLTGLIERTVS
ncbi:chromate transporter [Cupriavidus sp. YR651]|uniref:chromate efflux transporter n=1 Tax=Cupriavidus sp. YR651 TaxID=1855315 RepID=UPI00088067F3|nr:chromate efflux transporter [Cupriavidus sp. YR651]SDD92063.1 chromate transporter [Cupriavidus sp. YR651]